MIPNKKEILTTIQNFGFFQDSELSHEEKIENLDLAIKEAVRTICGKILNEEERVHLAYSGGVDSSVILNTIIENKFPVTAHTIASNKNHPDMIHSEQYISFLAEKNKDIIHKKYIIEVNNSDLIESNNILNKALQRVDNYYHLFKAISDSTNNIMNCDCIDEFLGGYYLHQKPNTIPGYDENKNLRQNRILAFNYFKERLVPDHLEILDKFSAYFDVTSYLPYGDKLVAEAAQSFSLDELIDDDNRKKPIYELARRNNIVESIIKRKKYGLVSAMD